jgi:hypothetical protein
MNAESYILDQFWSEYPQILLQANRLTEFIPTSHMSNREKLNATVRFCFYMSVILLLFGYDGRVLYIFLLSLLITYLFFRVSVLPNSTSKYGDIEKFSENRPNKCVSPTRHNPFMNMMVGSDHGRTKACNNKQVPDLEERIDDAFNVNLFKDVNDVYGRRNSQRQFFTMPWTQSSNEQGKFADWLYKTPPTLKERDTIYADQKPSLVGVPNDVARRYAARRRF